MGLLGLGGKFFFRVWVGEEGGVLDELGGKPGGGLVDDLECGVRYWQGLESLVWRAG